MSSFLRRLPLSRLLLLCAILVGAGILGTALASAIGSDPTPAPKPLAQAVHDALSAARPQGFSAHVTFVNHLVEGATLQGQQGGGSGAGGGGNPIISGAEGRVWIANDGKMRLELQSDKGATQILYDGSALAVYQASSNTLYTYAPSSGAGSSGAGGPGDESAHAGQGGDASTPPSVAKIQEGIERLMGHVDLSGAIPSDVGGQPAYAVRISPRANGGLVGGAELAWDANHGVPLKLAVYAKGNPAPVLSLTATEVSYGPIESSVFSLSLPEGVKRTQIAPPHGSTGTDGSSGTGAKRPQIDASTTGLSAVQAKLPFTLQAPSTLAGMSRHQVRLIEVNGHAAALISYGEGLGGIVVIESQAKAGSTGEHEGSSGGSSEGSPSGLSLPQVSIGGAKASELPTALGTLLSFQSGGIDHVLAGSVTASTLQAAARGL
jgi:outer membrane lipoprotein-sorting protein